MFVIVRPRRVGGRIVPLEMTMHLRSILGFVAGVSLSAVCFGADPILIPPAPSPVPGGNNSIAPLIPPAPSPVPGGSSGPVAVPGGSTAPGPTQPGGPVPGQVVPPPVVTCPPSGVIVWYPDEYSWGLGYWRGNTPWGYRVGGNPNEPLGVTSRRVDPQALPALPTVVALTPQQEALRLLRTGAYERAAGALGVLVSHARNAASGALGVPPGSSAPPTAVPTVPVPTATPAPAGAVPEVQWTVGETQRLLALALLGQKLEAQAVRAMGEAYAAEPSLCDSRLTSDVVGSSETLRRLMLRAITHAQKVKTSDAWFLAAAMMQAQGRTAMPDGVRKGLGKHPLAGRIGAGPAKKP
jgi:hypothetical protein